MAVAVPLTKQNIALQKKIDAQESKNALVTLGNKMSRSLANAKTPDDCRHVMRSIETHIAAHKTAGLNSDVKQLYKWLERCRVKCKKLENEHHYEGEEDTEQQDQDEDQKETDEKLPCASHVVIATVTSTLPLSALLTLELVADTMQKIPPHPDFVIARALMVKATSKAKSDKGGDGDKADDGESDKAKDADQVEVVDVSTFDQMPSEYVPGYLAISGTRPDCPLPGVWHEIPEARVQMPCTVAVLDSTVLVSDGPTARVLVLPSGQATGETYTFYEDGAPPVFKVKGASNLRRTRA